MTSPTLLRRSDERFRLLIERASIGIDIGNETGRLSYVNPALLKLIGYTADEVARGNVRWDELTPGHYGEADRNALTQLKTLGIAEPYEKVYRAKGGRHVPVFIGAATIPKLDRMRRETTLPFLSPTSLLRRRRRLRLFDQRS